MPSHEPKLPASFMARGDDSSGLLKHKDGKGATCLGCGVAFSFLQNAKRHFASRHTKLVPGDCTICGQAFKSQEALKRHLNERHGFGNAGTKVKDELQQQRKPKRESGIKKEPGVKKEPKKEPTSEHTKVKKEPTRVKKEPREA